MIEKIKGKDHLVQKRDGRLEKYSPAKLKRAINWCTNDSETLTAQLFESLNLKIYNKIKIDKLWDEVIETAANMISEMYPIWDDVAKRAYLLKIYKDNYNYNATIDSLKFQDIIDKGIQVGV
ncbi:MAG: ribonucleoside-diphosphate reductase subunit alpha, partial [Candidatus Cloacimonadota bacterium]